MIPHGLENLHVIEEEARRKTFEIAQRGGGGVDSRTEGGPDGSGDKKKRKWTIGELDFEALMRMLDNAVSVQHMIVIFFQGLARTLVTCFLVKRENMPTYAQ